MKPKITKEIKIKMKKLRKEGLTYKKIAKIFNISQSTAMYHLSKEYREKSIKRMMEYQQERGDRKEYLRKYMRKRYNEDPEFKARQQKYSREYQRKKSL